MRKDSKIKMTKLDPSRNVILLVKSYNKRNDDLRDAAIRRLNDLQKAESERIDEKLKDHAHYTKMIAKLETKRLDAIRAVDVAAVQSTSEKVAAQTLVLASNVNNSNEQLRNLIDSTARSIAETLKSQTTALADRLLVIEKAQYESKGRSGVEDPLKAESTKEMGEIKSILVKHVAETGGKVEGSSKTLGWVIAAVMFIISVTGFILGFIK